jgi:hypothetical protein
MNDSGLVGLSENGETWKVVADWPDYCVSDLGRVACVKQGVAQILKFTWTSFKRRYPAVNLHRLKKRTRKLVHVLVLESFVGPRPDGMQACHNDGNPANPRLSNLRWDTPKANQADRVKHGTDLRGEDIRNSKITEQDVLDIRSGKIDRRDARDRLGISFSNYHRIIERSMWAHLPPQPGDRVAKRFERLPDGRLLNVALRDAGIGRGDYNNRIRIGWAPIEAATTPKLTSRFSPLNPRFVPKPKVERRKSKQRVEYNGRQVTFAEIARIVGMSGRAMRYRYAKGQRGADLLRPAEQGKRLAGQAAQRSRDPFPDWKQHPREAAAKTG